MRMWTGSLELDLLLGDVHSLKEKRSLVRPLLAEIRRRFAVSAAEVAVTGCPAVVVRVSSPAAGRTVIVTVPVAFAPAPSVAV